MSLTPQDVIHYIQENEDENWLVECVYIGAVEGFSTPRNDLSKLDHTVHIERILKPFLINWGMMAQPLTRKGMRWTQLTARLQKLASHFNPFRTEDLLHVKFESNDNAAHIKEIYNRLDDIRYVGATAVSKIVHIMNPEVFIMWDKSIRELYKVEDSATGYLEFLDINKRLLETVFTDKELKDLRLKFRNKTLAKLIDEFNWYITNADRTPQITATRRKVKALVKTLRAP
jgi:hypothetical protein